MVEIVEKSLHESDDKIDELLQELYISKTFKKLKSEVDYHWNGLSKHFYELILDNYADIIENELKQFEHFKLSTESKELLRDIAIYSCYESNTGIIIAGFGKKEIFPATCSITVGSIYKDKLRYKINEDESKAVTRDNPAAIIPFAQHEMVDAFLEGVIPAYHNESKEYLKKIIENYPTDILEIITKGKKLDDDTIDYIKESIDKIQAKQGKLIENYGKAMDEVKMDHKMPIYGAVINLPKDELALMAESMVNITSLKRKYSFDEDETVGGTIDVAIISKGDGFVWIKRKHYFDPELNHHFFKKYY